MYLLDTYIIIFVYLHKNEYFSVHVCPFGSTKKLIYAFLNGSTGLDDIFCVCLNGSRNDLDSQLGPVGPIRGGAQTGILRFTMGMFVYKWMLYSFLFTGEIISRN